MEKARPNKFRRKQQKKKKTSFFSSLPLLFSPSTSYVLIDHNNKWNGMKRSNNGCTAESWTWTCTALKVALHMWLNCFYSEHCDCNNVVLWMHWPNTLGVNLFFITSPKPGTRVFLFVFFPFFLSWTGSALLNVHRTEPLLWTFALD